MRKTVAWQHTLIALALGGLFGLSGGTSSASVIFADDFNRANGPVGNGWMPSPSNSGDPLVLSGGALTTSGAATSAGIYRALNYSGSIVASATITDHNGFGGLQDRFSTQFLFGGNGDPSRGYSVEFYRGDQNFANSRVAVRYDGVTIASASSSFQFSSEIEATVNFGDDGHISGSVAGGGGFFNFDFGDVGSGISGLSTFGLFQEGPDERSAFLTHGTIDDLVLSSSGIPTFTTTYTLGTGIFEQLSQYQVGFDGTDFGIQMDIWVDGDEVAAEILAEWEAGIEGIWGDNKYYVSTPFGDRELSFDVQFVADGDAYDTRIVGLNADCRPNSLEWCTMYGAGNGQIVNQQLLAAHEFGHLLGLADEYEDVRVTDRLAYELLSALPSEQCRSFRLLSGEFLGRSGDRCGNLMSDLTGGALPRHYETILAQLAENVGFTPVLGYSPDQATYVHPVLPPDFPGLSESAVPEPATWAALIVGFGLAGSFLRGSRPALRLN